MTDRYIPPSVRYKENKRPAAGSPQRGGTAKEDAGQENNHASSSSSATYESSLLSPDDILQHFWPTTEGPASESSSRGHSGTLNSSAAGPQTLAYIMLFHTANPRWKTEKIIFTKTRIHLLPSSPKAASSAAAEMNSADAFPGAEQGATVSLANAHNLLAKTNPIIEAGVQARDFAVCHDGANSGSRIAVFEQVRSNKFTHHFAFSGWYKIEHVHFLEPRSDGLRRMLEQKWEGKNQGKGRGQYGKPNRVARDDKGWGNSLECRWAVIKLEKDQRAEDAKGKLWIKQTSRGDEPQDQPEKKSVNELLAELRMSSD